MRSHEQDGKNSYTHTIDNLMYIDLQIYIYIEIKKEGKNERNKERKIDR